MPTSEAKIAANQRNAQLSTGPRTEAGKNIVRHNAKRDGITGQITTLSASDRPFFENLRTEFIRDLAPKTTMELKLASSIAWDTWRLDLLRVTEMSLYTIGAEHPANAVDCDDPEIRAAMVNARTFCQQSAKLALLSLYEQRLNRSLHKNLATLRVLQADRKAEEENVRKDEITLARANRVTGKPYKVAAAAANGGYVFTNEEIITAANRELDLELANTALWGVNCHKEAAAIAAATNLVSWPSDVVA